MTPPARRIPAPYLESPRRRRVGGFLAAAAPDEIRGCFVPLLDGGTAAIALLQRHPEGWFGFSSPNADVVAVWEGVRDDVDGVIAGIQELAAGHSATAFARVRDQPAESVERMPRAARAARFVYLRGAARSDADGEPVPHVAEAEYGRDTVAFDAAGLRELANLLRARDIAFAVRGLFEVLPEVGEDDLVVLDPPAPEPDARELRSFVGALAAKGAGVLARDLGDGFYAGWPGMVRIAESPGDEPVWVNTVLQRARSAAARRDR
ncbi:hypothetical protein [Herbiconiux ginsengi]|uniref:site-specific DNA-methyltransferase (adenine-specific) n=1 Tax=Herbiconiux ginsengi TaxID=381665 RepID=A0A1H3PGZ7_9MICO|nr:hypothetical protein [Herbiconiux ginsengi]SDZ00321.1 hypothetical protein SAMN05216554_1885 [Herbiconiux ginsengi]